MGEAIVAGLSDNYVPVRLEFMNEKELQKKIKSIQLLIGSDNVTTCERPTHPQSQIEREECSVQNTDMGKTIYVKRPHSIWKKTTLICESGLKDIKTVNQVLDEIGIDMTDIELLNDYSIYRLIGSKEAIQNAMKMIQDTIGMANIDCEKCIEQMINNRTLERTIYVKAASVTKKLTDKRGRMIYQIIDKSGVENLELESKWSGGYVRLKAANGETYIPVHLTGTKQTVHDALELVQEAVGTEHIDEDIELPAAKNPDQPLKQEYDKICRDILAIEHCPSTRGTIEARKKYEKINEFQKKLVEEHFYPLINKTQPEHLARKITDMLYDTSDPELLIVCEQYLHGNLSVLEDKIQSSIKKIEDDKRADRNRKKNAKKRQRKKEEAAAKVKTKQAEEEEELAGEKTKQKNIEEEEGQVLSSSRIRAEKIIRRDISQEADQEEDVGALENSTPSDMNSAVQENDVSKVDEATTRESAVLEKEEAPPTETNHLPNQYEDVPGVTECISSTTQDYNKSVQEEEDSVFSKIGINSTQGMATRETITESSVSSVNDGSKAPKAISTADINENDPLLIFLRSQHACIKGSVEEFYTWLVESEDIDSMMALEEAVSEEEYLNNRMKKGNGSSGVKGFKLKPFQRAVQEYSTKSTGHHSLPQCQMKKFSETLEPPDELVCPISLVLMTNDPVVAADGITYERASIEDWFKKSKTEGHIICSPVHGTEMESLSLMPNISLRNVARAFKDEK